VSKNKSLSLAPQLWLDGVITFRTALINMDVDLRHFLIGHADFVDRGSVVDPGYNTQLSSHAGAANKSKHGIQAMQRLGVVTK
jgi:hypothetical protein